MPPLLSVWVELSANSRQGFTTNNQAWRPAPDAINSTTAIGLRAGLFLEAVRKSHCARYYNPITGRFMSRDPNDPKLIGPNRTPIDPKKLHKYLYAGGDPVDAADPTGRESFVSYAITTLRINIPTMYVIAKFGCTLATVYNGLYTAVAYVANGGHSVGFGDPGFSPGFKETCAALTGIGLFL